MTRPEIAIRRRRERRRLWVSLGIAALIHILAFGVVLRGGETLSWTPGMEAVRLEDDSWTGQPVDIFFGPPRIFEADGTTTEQPPERTLEAARLVTMPRVCLERDIPPAGPGAGQVRLTVNSAGRVTRVVLTRSTGDRCWDAVALRVGGQLWYRWLPNGRHPAPVEVLQPLTVRLGQF